jgi:hypothetical protein
VIRGAAEGTLRGRTKSCYNELAFGCKCHMASCSMTEH